MNKQNSFDTCENEIELHVYDNIEQKEHQCYLYLTDEQMQRVFDLLDANPAAEFADLPEDIRKAADEAVAEYALEHPLSGNYKMQKNIPDDMITLYAVNHADDEDDELTEEEIKELQAISTKDELFRYIDKKLTDEDREVIRKADPSDLHFGFGTWIRNTFIYSDWVDIEAILFGGDSSEPIFIHEDEMSSQIIECYQTYLNNNTITNMIETTSKQEYEAAVEAYRAQGKSVITFQLKGEYFEQIVKGEKKQEYREITEKNETKLLKMDADGYAVEDENGNSVPKHYDAIQFLNGYNANRACMLIEIKDAFTEILVDANNEPISYEKENGDVFVCEQLTYDLGQILVLKHKG